MLVEQSPALHQVLTTLDGIIGALYTVCLHGRYGQTVGKRATRVKLLDFRTEEPASWQQVWLREAIPLLLLGCLLPFQLATWLLRIPAVESAAISPSLGETLLGLIPLLWFLLELLTLLFNAKRRALQDLIAGTVVVRTHIADPIDEPREPEIKLRASLYIGGVRQGPR